MTDSIKSSLCDYSDAHIFVTGNTTVTSGNEDIKVAFKISTPFKTCWTEINDKFVNNADYIYILCTYTI